MEGKEISGKPRAYQGREIADSHLVVTERSTCDEAIQLSNLRRQSWIASLSLSSGAHSRDPLARNDGLKLLE
jgi:hypothetical protein